jgi:FMN-dependent NADH-azoreductase
MLVIASSGSDFQLNTPGGACHFLELYLQAELGFMGITHGEIVYAHSQNKDDATGVKALAKPQRRVTELANAA